MVNIELPVGVTVAPASGCGGGTLFGYCMSVTPGSPFGGPPGCSAPTGLTVDGNVVSVAIACAPEEYLSWDMSLSSLITTTGSYDTDVVFKVGSTRRTADNMYKIPNVGPLIVEAS